MTVAVEIAVRGTKAGEDLPFKVRPLWGETGGEVDGFDLANLAQHCTSEQFLTEVSRRGVLVFHDQNLTPEQYATFSRFCGEVEYHVLDQYRLEEAPEIYVLSNIEKDGKPIGNPKDGFGWHTDSSYVERPTSYTLLYGLQTPPEGGDTLFASAERAYEKLDPALKQRIDGLTALHSYVYMFTGNPTYMRDNATDGGLTAEQKNAVPDVVHPLVRTHPLTGRKSLYLGGDCIVSVNGLEAQDSKTLLETLFNAVLTPENQHAFKWSKNDVVIWDNRNMMHSATEYDRNRFQRLLWRTTVRGEIPR